MKMHVPPLRNKRHPWLGLFLLLCFVAWGLPGCKFGGNGEVKDQSPKLSLTDSSLTVKDVTTSGFTLNWVAAAGGAEPVTYEVYISTSSKLETTAQVVDQGTLQSEVTASKAVITGLRRGTKYYINVLARDQDGATRLFAATKTTTNETDTTVPSSIGISIAAGAATSNSATVSVALSAIDDAAIRGYYLSTSSTAPAATDSGWVTVGRTTDYSATVSYSFSDTTNGSKTLYLWFKDATGNVSDSASDSIGIFYDWAQEAYIKPSVVDTLDNFGNTLALSGDLAAVGARLEDSNQTTITTSPSSDNSAGASGAVQVFVRSGTSWTAEAYIKAPNADINDYFGGGLALNGSTLVVGAAGESSSQTTITNGATASTDNSAASAGAAYVFLRSGTSWTQQAYIKAPNAEASDSFGNNLALDGDTLVVGAWAEDSSQTTITNGTTASGDNSATDAGAAYVFLRSGTSWSQQAYLKAPNAEAGDVFGGSVAISGDTILVGARWEASNQTSITNGATASSNNSISQAGAAYVFIRSGTSWSQQAYLKAPNPSSGDNFGFALALDGDTAAVGAYAEDSIQTTITNSGDASTDNSVTDAGAVYVFKRSGTTWSQEAYIKAPNAEAGDYFGISVALSGDLLAVSAPVEDSAQNTITNGTTASSNNSASGAGAVYVFARDNSSWTQKAYIKAPNAESGDSFGLPLALDSDSLLISAQDEDSSQASITNGTWATADNSTTDSGAVYLFVADP